MKLVEFFADLSRLELRNLSLANEGDGTIALANQPTIVGYINDGLRRLYADFLLSQKDVLVLMQSHITNYHLITRFAEQYVAPSPASDEKFRYILDLNQEPFLGDVIRILSVFNSYGTRLPINDDAQPMSVFTPQSNVLQVPFPQHDQTLSVLYQAKHRKLLGDLQEEIVIPDILEEALRGIVAYKAFSHMNTAVSSAKAAEHLQNYTALLRDVLEKDLVNTSVSASNTRFDQGGWV